MLEKAERGPAGQLDFDPREESSLVMRFLRTALGIQVRESDGADGVQITHLGRHANEVTGTEVLLRSTVTATSPGSWESALHFVQVEDDTRYDLIEVSRRVLRTEDDFSEQLEEVLPAVLGLLAY